MYASIKQELVELKIIHSQNVLVFMLHAGGGGGGGGTALVGQIVHVHYCHIHVSFAFYQLFLRIIGNFLLNNGVDK